MLERVGKGFLTERKLADGPDLGVLHRASQSHTYQSLKQALTHRTYRLQGLLDLSIQSAGLEGDDLRSGIRVMSDWGTTLGAEDAVDSVTGRTLASPALDRTGDLQLFLGDNGDKGYDKVNNWAYLETMKLLTVGRATLALAVIAMIIASDQRGVNVHGVRDGFAEAVSGERHCVD